MKVIVTGSHGYIGSVLVPMLLASGHKVIGIDSDLYEGCTYGAEMRTDFLHLRKDIRDVEEKDVLGADAVIHLAALSNDPLSDINPALTFEINHAASVRLAKLAKEAGVSRFLFSSSCSTYGAAGDDLLDESAEFHPVTPYGESKVMVERDVSELSDNRFSPVFLRNATAYGVSPRLRFDLVLNNLVAWDFTTGIVYIKSDGTPWRPIVHVEDISRAFLAALDAPREVIHNQAFNVGINEENYRIRDLGGIVKDTVPGCRIEYAKDGGPDKRCYRADFRKYFSSFPGFRLKWNARDGARQLFECYQQYGLAQEEFEGPRFKRIDRIKGLLEKGRLAPDLRWKNIPLGGGKA